MEIAVSRTLWFHGSDKPSLLSSNPSILYSSRYSYNNLLSFFNCPLLSSLNSLYKLVKILLSSAFFSFSASVNAFRISFLIWLRVFLSFIEEKGARKEVSIYANKRLLSCLESGLKLKLCEIRLGRREFSFKNRARETI